MYINGAGVNIAYKFEGYRILLIHTEESIWDDIHSRIAETDCDLFAVNSVKDALALVNLMDFDIIISAYDLNEANGRELMQNLKGQNRNAIKFLKKNRRDSGVKWRLLLRGVGGLSRNSLEMESMLAVISHQYEGKGGRDACAFGLPGPARFRLPPDLSAIENARRAIAIEADPIGLTISTDSAGQTP
jgi:hypothetical protein